MQQDNIYVDNNQESKFYCEVHPESEIQILNFGEISQRKSRLLCIQCILESYHKRKNFDQFVYLRDVSKHIFQFMIDPKNAFMKILYINNKEGKQHMAETLDEIENLLLSSEQSITNLYVKIKENINQMRILLGQIAYEFYHEFKLEEAVKQILFLKKMDSWQGTNELTNLENHLNMISENFNKTNINSNDKVKNNQQKSAQDIFNNFNQVNKEIEKLVKQCRDKLELIDVIEDVPDFEEQKRIIQEREQPKNQKILVEEQKFIQRSLQEKQPRQQSDSQNTEASRTKLGQLLKNKAIGSMGYLEICFVIDITNSMDKYKEQTQDCIIGSSDAIRKETGRKTRWSTIAYQDIREWKKNNNQYIQHDFVEDAQKIADFLKSLKCDGGDDYCEDIKGALEQMISNKLNWKTPFRVAVLICDAPAHGKNVNMGCGDNFPEDDITPTINKLIDLKIIFIVIQFSEWTKQMIELMKNLYKQKGKSDLFISVDLQTIKIEDAWKHLINIIKEASAVATGVKNSASKIKENQEQKLNGKFGAIEALYNKEIFKNFYQQADISRQNEFQVFRVDLYEKSFEDNMSQIQNISNADVQIFEEGKWNCIITKEPYAQGMTKSVYLLKKMNDPGYDLYVIKTPLEGFYETLDKAKAGCRSHLIYQNLMRKFMKTLREKHEFKKKPHQQYPEIYYSDLLILQENEKKFWIAERYFDGEFIKYNNNWGFINDKLIPLNQLAQAFTLFTFCMSNYQYMINDVQGVGVFFTEPSVVTSTGDYDDMDTGEEDKKKDIVKDILEVMDILID